MFCRSSKQQTLSLMDVPPLFHRHLWYHLPTQHSNGQSLINGGFHGKIIHKWAIFRGYIKEPEGIVACYPVQSSHLRLPPDTGGWKPSVGLARGTFTWRDPERRISMNMMYRSAMMIVVVLLMMICMYIYIYNICWLILYMYVYLCILMVICANGHRWCIFICILVHTVDYILISYCYITVFVLLMVIDAMNPKP